MSSTNNHKSFSQKGKLYILFEKYIEKYSSTDTNTVTEGIAKGVMEMIIAEAKKDYQTVHANYDNNTPIPEINRQMNYKQREWVRKWFGDIE